MSGSKIILEWPAMELDVTILRLLSALRYIIAKCWQGIASTSFVATSSMQMKALVTPPEGSGLDVYGYWSSFRPSTWLYTAAD